MSGNAGCFVPASAAVSVLLQTVPSAALAPTPIDELRSDAIDGRCTSEGPLAATLARVIRTQNNLGRLYESGMGVAQDLPLARHWYRMAAEQGLALAQRNLCKMYEEGLGGTADRDQALLWYRRAAAQGDSEAQGAVARLGG